MHQAGTGSEAEDPAERLGAHTGLLEHHRELGSLFRCLVGVSAGDLGPVLDGDHDRLIHRISLLLVSRLAALPGLRVRGRNRTWLLIRRLLLGLWVLRFRLFGLWVGAATGLVGRGAFITWPSTFGRPCAFAATDSQRTDTLLVPPTSGVSQRTRFSRCCGCGFGGGASRFQLDLGGSKFRFQLGSPGLEAGELGLEACREIWGRIVTPGVACVLGGLVTRLVVTPVGLGPLPADVEIPLIDLRARPVRILRRALTVALVPAGGWAGLTQLVELVGDVACLAGGLFGGAAWASEAAAWSRSHSAWAARQAASSSRQSLRRRFLRPPTVATAAPAGIRSHQGGELSVSGWGCVTVSDWVTVSGTGGVSSVGSARVVVVVGAVVVVVVLVLVVVVVLVLVVVVGGGVVTVTPPYRQPSGSQRMRLTLA